MSDKQPRHPWDWYVEQPWVTRALLAHADLDRSVPVWDPFCGMGNVVAALSECGYTAYGTDIHDRSDNLNCFDGHDFLGDQRCMFEAFNRLSIVMNPAYSYQDDVFVPALAEKIIRKALGIATDVVAALLPVKWLASGGRYALFSEFKPIGIYILCERPSMPPGNIIAELGDRAFRRGKIDYCWIVWDKTAEPLAFAPTYWIPARPLSERRA